MNVERIYTRGVVRAPRSPSIGEAAVLMRRHNVGLLLVTEDAPGEYQAIGTDRDPVTEALAQGFGPDEAKVGDVMTRQLGTVAADADLHEAIATINQGGFRRLAVSDGDGRIVVVLSVDGIIDGIVADLSGLSGVMKISRGAEAGSVLLVV